MVSKREYLIERGLAKPGRGRMSSAAHDAIKQAINSGVKFTDGTENSSAGIGATPDPRPDRPEGMYVFRNPDGTEFKRLHTNACANCHYSFQWCYCLDGTTQFPYPHVTGQPDDARAILVSTPARAVITTTEVPAKQPTRGRGRPRKTAKANAA
jgi:hypothetical protein